MKRGLIILVGLAGMAGVLPLVWSQTADDPNEGVRVEQDAVSGDWQLKWWGKLGRTYFIQYTDDLRNDWSWVPLVESGADGIKAWSFTGTSDKFFLRLAYSDQPVSDPLNGDSDGDGIGNLDELNQNTDPLSNIDSDFDGQPDDWETFHNLDPDNSDDADLDSDDDGLTNAQEADIGSNPNTADTDGDGVDDGEDGWALLNELAPARVPVPNYAVISLRANGKGTLINNKGQVIIQDESGSAYYFYNGNSIVNLPSDIDAVSDLNDHGVALISNYSNELAYNRVGVWDQIAGVDLFPDILSDLPVLLNYFQSLDSNFDEVLSLDAIDDPYLHDQFGYSLNNNSEAVISRNLGINFLYSYDSSAGSGQSISSFSLKENLSVSSGLETVLGNSEYYLNDQGSEIYASSTGLSYNLRDANNYLITAGWFLDGNADEGLTGWGVCVIKPDGTVVKLYEQDPDLPRASNARVKLNDYSHVVSRINAANGLNNLLWINTQSGLRNENFGLALSYAEISMPADLDSLMQTYGLPNDFNNQMTLLFQDQLWLNAQTYSIEDLVQDSGNSYTNFNCIDINDTGLITGSATNSSTGNTDAVILLPFELESTDRALKGSVEIPESWTQFGLSFRNKDTGQDLGTYEDLEPGATTDVHIYDSADDFFSDTEMQQNANGTLPNNILNQEVVFARHPDNPQQLEFSTVFDELGEIEIVITFGPNQTQGIVTHTLEEDTEMSEFITRMDQRVSSLEVPGGEDILIDEDGDGVPDGGGTTDILQAFQPGTLNTPGAPVGEYHENDPANLTLLVNSDDDNGNNQTDNGDTVIDTADNDIVRLLLKRPVHQPADSGTLTLSVIGGTGNVRLFTTDGQNELTNYSVDLASPAGDLAGLANGNLPVYVEGLAQANDVTVIWSYTDAGGTPQVSDEVHLNVVDPSLITMMNQFAPSHGGLHAVYGNPQRVRSRSYAANGVTMWSEMALTPVGEALPIKNRGMLARIFWATPRLRQQIAFTKGFVDGFWVALKGEAETVAGVWQFFTDDPFGRTAAMWAGVNEAIDELREIPADEIPTLLADIAKNITDDLYTQAEAALPWQPLEANLSPDVLYYMYGFAVGTVTEGVVVSLLGVGLVTKTASVIKGVIATAKTGKYSLGVLSAARKSTNKVTHMMLRMADTDSASVRIGAIGKYLEKTEVPSGRKMSEVIDEAFLDKPNLSKRYYQNLKNHWPDITDEARRATRYQKAQHSLAEMADIMGNDLTDDALEGFGLLQKRLFVENVDDADRWADLSKLMRDLDNPQKKQALNRSLEEYKVAVEADPDAKFWLRDIDQIYSVGYRYNSFEPQGGWSNFIGSFPARPEGWYASFDLYDNKFIATDKLLLPLQTSAPRYRFEFSITAVKDISRAAKAKQETKDFFELLARDKPDNFVGGGTSFVGEGTQFIIDGSFPVTRVVDMDTGLQVWPIP
ncbi:MAG: hypothetical protein AAGH72_07330 [Verrucomicrobiota bacterium]